MVKAEVKTAKKRKNVTNDSPAKKAKVANGQGAGQGAQKLVQQKKTPPQAKNGAALDKQNKKNPSIKQEDTKPVKPFKGTKQLSVKAEKSAQNEKTKKKRNTMFKSLILEARAKEGQKDPELLSKIEERLANISSRTDDLTKTAKKKLALLNKLKIIAEEGSEAAHAQKKKALEAKKAEKLQKKAAAAGEVTVKVENTKKQQQQKKPQQQQKKLQQQQKKPPLQIKKEEASDDDEDEEDDDDSNDEQVDEEDSDAEVEGEDDDDDDEDEEDDEDDDDDDEDEEEDETPAPKETPKITSNIQPSLEDLQTSDLVKKGQKRFVLFVGNIAYDTQKDDLAQHFSKIGEIIDIRIPTDKLGNKPRGFAYIEVNNEVAYEKCLSMHHSSLKGRRINVLYTQGGKKKGDNRKKEIKVKNMKLHALRKQGKLAGSTKETQKRSFRRNKKKFARNSED
ncbi:hypothetical protein ABEB36_002706 [Hypothenemus hampei]|uniref:RRM domain-containing protein n=1 Tax=Hypothenemus hampei TaxID=57062 RepID=A0ABD1F6T7_HYPHA